MEWPRFFATNGYEFVVYQPQLANWSGNQLEGRFATGVRPAGTSNETYGVVFFKARTEVDKANRLVTLEDVQITRMEFPTERSMQGAYQAIIQSELPKAAKTIPLDHLEATYAVSAEVAKVATQKVQNNPPNVIYATQPSLLVQIDGAPILKPLMGNYQRVVNTRAILLLDNDPINQGYYLYAASNWYSAPVITGPWAVNLFPPSDIGPALAAALATQQVDPAYPRQPLAAPPAVYVVTSPSELIQSTGTANLLSIAGTDLLYVSNTDNAIFYYLDDGNFYVLISGRWFKSTALTGPWAYVASGSLPADFKNIPPDSPKSNVLLSVAGTPQAQEAVIAATIPQTATIYRDKAALTVEYVAGAPSFTPIAGTTMYYAANTITPVIMLNATTYYACQNGAWFVANTASGPWVVATSVPTVIYTIPTSCPIHYVTYSYVYGYTPTVVYVGYTPGYLGVVVAPGGVVVYGTGYVYPAVVVGTTYVSYPPTYGSGAAFAMGAAVGFAFGYCAGHSTSCYYEPYYGCYAYPHPYSYAGYNCCSYSCYSHYGTAVSGTTAYGYNPYTGTGYKSTYANTYNPYTGTHGTVSGGAAYNPYTGQAARGGSGSFYNPYSGASANAHAGGTANMYTGNYSRYSSASGYNPSTGRSYSGSTSSSGNFYSGNYSGTHSTSASGQSGATSLNSSTTVSGNAYNHTATASSSGSAYNANSGNSASWGNGSMTTDKNGNTSTYDKGDTSANQATYQSANSSDKSTAQSQASSAKSSYSGSSASSASREQSAQASGSQRASSWGGSGGGDSGASHSGGWGGSGGGGFGDSHSWGGGSSGGGGGWGGRGGGGRR